MTYLLTVTPAEKRVWSSMGLLKSNDALLRWVLRIRLVGFVQPTAAPTRLLIHQIILHLWQIKTSPRVSFNKPNDKRHPEKQAENNTNSILLSEILDPDINIMIETNYAPSFCRE